MIISRKHLTNHEWEKFLKTLNKLRENGELAMLVKYDFVFIKQDEIAEHLKHICGETNDN